MEDKKIVVPEGMLKAALGGIDMARNSSAEKVYWVKQGLEAALLWLSDNPMIPSGGQDNELLRRWEREKQFRAGSGLAFGAIEWQRLMFFDIRNEPK